MLEAYLINLTNDPSLLAFQRKIIHMLSRYVKHGVSPSSQILHTTYITTPFIAVTARALEEEAFYYTSTTPYHMID